MIKRYLLLILFFHSLLNLNAQQITISGTVVAVDDGSALPGVSIVVKGSTQGTITDLDGKYSITVSSSKDSLQFSYLGMLTQLIAINNQVVINVKMVADQKT
ncbi:MAG: carboxypeptidase-like regulatory domain-containing protein [Bacteroidetes bacterium]|nr:carboxypeptidase-like regulatory domain-containing protein [Bacteroidota bacterium]